MKKQMNSLKDKFFGTVLATLLSIINVLAQMPTVRSQGTVDAGAVQEDFTWWYLILFVLVLSLGGLFYYRYSKKRAASKDSYYRKGWKDEWSKDSLKAKKGKAGGALANQFTSSDLEMKERRRKLEKMAFDKLPISKIDSLIPAPPIEELPYSNDEGLLSAIEQSHDEYEEDPDVREVALRVLSKFRYKNSMDALAQVALYDLSANLRSDAVSALADIDHSSVFESVLLACADPTREVRAAAARALFRLSADRAEAWTRIAECGDEYRIVQAARAAIESELVDRSIDRLVHDDEKQAYEAFALVALLIAAGETKEIFEVMENQRNTSVKLAILHCLKVVQDERTLSDLYAYIERNSLPEDLSNAANDVIKSFNMVAA